jgi:endonuclease I
MIINLEELELGGKKVLIRQDLNVPIKAGVRRSATGCKVNSSLASPSVGRPRCDINMTLAPCFIYFYLLTAYYDKVQDWHSPILTGNNFTPWAQKILLKWHKQDPVSDKERRRNKQIMKIQGNYNPFIVSPKLVGKIWKDN